MEIDMKKIKTKEIKGFDGLYTINTMGKVFSMKTGKEKTQLLSNAGYYRVHLFNNGKGKIFSVHRLVAETFIPNSKKLPCVNHIDGNKLNNRVSNLEWVSYADNNAKAVKTGLSPQGADVYNSAFSEEQVHFIRELFFIGYSKTKLARVFKVSVTALTDMVNGKTYSNIEVSPKYNDGKEHFSPQVIYIIYNLLENGYSYSQIASMCGINKEAVRTYYRNHYLPEKQKK